MIGRAIPNAITLLRILLAFPLVWLLLERQHALVLMLFAVAGASDALDGFLARRFDWGSRLGALLDPLADKILLVSAYLTLGWTGQLPAWLVGLVVLRDVVIVSGAALYRLVIGRVEMAPTMISKANTALQVLLVLATLVSLGVQRLPPLLLDGIILSVVATTVASGAHYVWSWSCKAVVAKRRVRDIRAQGSDHD